MGAHQRDPIYKILKANERTYQLSRQMNDTLVRILERYELDKPILMQDKLDIIWDKSAKRKKPEAMPEKELETPEEEFARTVKESLMTAEEAYKVKEGLRLEALELAK